jgi:hypothetical protein
VSSCTLRPEWTWFVIKGVRSISANVVVLIDRIIVLNDRKISPRPLCNAKCQIRTRLPFILEMFTKLSSSVLTSLLYRTPPKTPSPTVQRLGSMRYCPGVTYNSVRLLRVARSVSTRNLPRKVHVRSLSAARHLGSGRVEKRRSDFSLPVAIGQAFAAPPQSGLTWLCFLFPLIAPDVRISRIRRSEKAHVFAHGRLAVRSVRLTKPSTW